MALPNSYKARIVANLPPEYRDMYAAGGISDDQLLAYADRVGIVAPPDFENVQTKVGGTEQKAAPPKAPSLIDDLGAAISQVRTSASAGLDRSIGANKFSGTDVPQTQGNPFFPEQPVAPSAIDRGLGGYLSSVSEQEKEAARLRTRQEGVDTFNEGQLKAQEAEKLAASIDRPWLRTASTAVADVAGSPSSLASLPGGMFATIPMIDSYNQEYVQSRMGGLLPNEAKARANAMSGIEGAISAVPTGRLLRTGGKALIAPSIDRFVSKVVGTGIKEGISEGATTLAQEAANSGFRAAGNDSQAAYAKARASLDLWSDVKRSTAAGFVGGAGVSSVTSPFEIAAENGRRATQVAQGDQRVGAKIREAAHAVAVATLKEAVAVAEQKDDAFKANAQATPDQQRIADEQEAGFRTIEARRKAEEEFAKNPANAIADQMRSYTVTPEMVAKERAADQKVNEELKVELAKAQENETLAPYRKEAEKELKKTFDSELTKEKSKYQAGKRKAATKAVEEAKSLPEADRVEFVARKRMEWDAANPAPTIDNIRAKYAPKQATPVAAPAQPVSTQAVDQPATDSNVLSEDAIRQFGLSSNNAQPSTGAAASDVVSAIQSKVGSSREAASLGRLIGDGKLVVLDRADQLPNYTPELKDTNGYYDGERMYIMADQLDPNNIKGSLLVVAAHEAKHAADVSGAGAKGVASIGQFIGNEANDSINSKIVQEAASGDEAARFAVEAVAGMDPATAKLELPAYYVSAAMNNRAERGRVGGALSDIVSAVRTKFGSEVNLNDVGYMANKLVQNIATGNESISGTTPGMQMVVGSAHPRFNERKKAGLTYIDYDGSEKTLISDSESTINVEAFSKLTAGSKADPERAQALLPAVIRAVKNHDNLGLSSTNEAVLAVLNNSNFESNWDWSGPLDGGDYKKDLKVIAEYRAARGKSTAVMFSDLVDTPSINAGAYAQMRSTEVRVNTSLPSGSAQLTPLKDGGFAIELAPDLVDTVNADPAAIKDILLHEMQHVVQFAEDFSRGGTATEFYTSDDIKSLADQKQVGQDLTKYIRTVFRIKGEMGNWPISFSTKNMIEDAMTTYDNSSSMTSTELAEDLDRIIELDGTQEESVINRVYQFKILALRNRDLNVRAREIRSKAYAKYSRLLGEREARFTQGNSRKSQQELDQLFRPRYYGEIGVARGRDKPTTVMGEREPVNWTDFGLASKVLPASNPGTLSEDMLNEVKAAVKGKRSVFTLKNAAGQFSGFGVLGRELGNVKELADGEAASIAYVAEGDYFRAKFGIEKMAIRRKMSVADANKEVNAILKEAEKIEDITRREAFIGRYAAANPELRPLVDALDNIAKQSKAIVAARVKDPRQMTEAELAKYSAIIKNRYTYFTRTYAAFQGKEGVARNRRLEREAQLAKAQISKKKAVSPQYRDAYRVYSRAVDFVINNDLAVFDPEMLAQQPLDRLDYLYSTWVGDPEKLRAQIRNDKEIKGDHDRREAYRAAAETAVAIAGQNINKEALQREGEFIVNGMLNLNEISNPVINYYRGMKEDTTLLRTREQVPEQIRELYGEITDLPTRIAITLAKQGELAARMRMLTTVYEQGKGKWYVDGDTFRSSDQYARYTEQLSGDNWGPLNGARVTPEIAAALNDGLDIFTPLQNALAQGHATVDRAAEVMGGMTMAGLRKASSTQKFIQIVLSPFNTAINFLGSWSVAAQNGGARPDDMLRALKASMKMLNNQLAPGGIQGKLDPMVTDPDLELFLKYTLLDSAVGQELRSMPTKFLKQLVLDLESATTIGQANRVMRKGRQKAGNAKGFITEMFALSDAWVKPAVFLSRVRFLERVNKAESKGWTQAQIEQQAADMTKDTTITFQRAAPAIKLVERMPLTWYATYIQGVFRSVGYSYTQAGKDFIESARAKTPEGQLLYALEGSKRLAGATAATIGAAAATKAIAGVFNDEEDEEMIAGAKKLLYAEGRYGDGIYLGQNEKDAPVFMRLSRIDPNGPVNDMIRIAMSEDSEEVKVRAIMDHMKDLWIMPRTTTDFSKFVMSVFSDDPVKNKKTKLERLFPATTTAFKDMLPADYGTAESALQLLDGFVPGAANAFDQESVKPVKDENAYRQLISMLTLYTGGRVDVADPSAAAFGAGSKLDTLQKEGRSQISEAMENLGVQAATDKYLELRESELNAYYKLKDVYDGMLQMGYSPAKASAVLKDNKVQAQDIAVIRQGRIPDNASGLINEDSLNKAGKFGDKYMTKEQATKSAKAREAAIKKLMLLTDKRN